MPKLTITDLKRAIATLEENNESITTLNLRKVLGHGSFSTITKLLKEIKNEKDINDNPTQIQITNLEAITGSQETKNFNDYLKGNSNLLSDNLDLSNNENSQSSLDEDEYINNLKEELTLLKNSELNLTKTKLKYDTSINQKLIKANNVLDFYLERIIDDNFINELPKDLITLLKILRDEKIKESKNLPKALNQSGVFKLDANIKDQNEDTSKLIKILKLATDLKQM